MENVHFTIVDGEHLLVKCIRITPIQCNDTYPWQSKIGGNPYQPKNLDYPMEIDEVGNIGCLDETPLILLAQLNFDEIPALEDYPKSGLLQFFISGDEIDHGMQTSGIDSEYFQRSYRLRYFPKIEKSRRKLVTDFDFVYDHEYNEMSEFPARKECALEFAYENEQINEKEDTCFHKIGGSPYIIHGDSDPTLFGKKDGERLLLQIASDIDNGVSWGDGGICHFYIQERDLKRMDFSHVVYSWQGH